MKGCVQAISGVRFIRRWVLLLISLLPPHSLLLDKELPGCEMGGRFSHPQVMLFHVIRLGSRLGANREDPPEELCVAGGEAGATSQGLRGTERTALCKVLGCFAFL